MLPSACVPEEVHFSRLSCVRLPLGRAKAALSNGRCMLTQSSLLGGADLWTEVNRSGATKKMGTFNLIRPAAAKYPTSPCCPLHQDCSFEERETV